MTGRATRSRTVAAGTQRQVAPRNTAPRQAAQRPPALRKGIQVLCRYANYPYWPAMIEHPVKGDEQLDIMSVRRTRGGESVTAYWCMFTNEGTGGWVPQDRIVVYHPNLATHIALPPSHDLYEVQSTALAIARRYFQRIPVAKRPKCSKYLPSDFSALPDIDTEPDLLLSDNDDSSVTDDVEERQEDDVVEVLDVELEEVPVKKQVPPAPSNRNGGRKRKVDVPSAEQRTTTRARKRARATEPSTSKLDPVNVGSEKAKQPVPDRRTTRSKANAGGTNKVVFDAESRSQTKLPEDELERAKQEAEVETGAEFAALAAIAMATARTKASREGQAREGREEALATAKTETGAKEAQTKTEEERTQEATGGAGVFQTMANAPVLADSQTKLNTQAKVSVQAKADAQAKVDTQSKAGALTIADEHTKAGAQARANSQTKERPDLLANAHAQSRIDAPSKLAVQKMPTRSGFQTQGDAQVNPDSQTAADIPTRRRARKAEFRAATDRAEAQADAKAQLHTNAREGLQEAGDATIRQSSNQRYSPADLTPSQGKELKKLRAELAKLKVKIINMKAKSKQKTKEIEALSKPCTNLTIVLPNRPKAPKCTPIPAREHRRSVPTDKATFAATINEIEIAGEHLAVAIRKAVKMRGDLEGFPKRVQEEWTAILHYVETKERVAVDWEMKIVQCLTKILMMRVGIGDLRDHAAGRLVSSIARRCKRMVVVPEVANAIVKGWKQQVYACMQRSQGGAASTPLPVVREKSGNAGLVGPVSQGVAVCTGGATDGGVSKGVLKGEEKAGAKGSLSSPTTVVS